MSLLVCFVLAVLVANSCEGKPAQFKGYPEENRNVNNPFSADLFEGDMLVDPAVKKIALSGGDISMATPGRKRGATKQYVWPNGIIPYVIDSTVSAHRDKIENAMREWENGTCLSFIHYVPNNGDVYLNIIGKWAGCFSLVGYPKQLTYLPKKYPREAKLNLGPNCLERRIILHELGHSIGFHHEQSRPDRDSYVNILSNNIMEGVEPNFAKYSNQLIDSLGFPYDLKSVMHYGPKAFSKNGQNTIEPVDPNKTLIVNENISDIDKQQVNKLYNCV